MIAPFHASPERDAAIEALLARWDEVGRLWTLPALQAAAGPDADLLFPEGPAEMAEAWSDAADRALVADTGRIASLPRVPDRIRAAILARLDGVRPHRDALARALAAVAKPTEAPRAVRITARTADALWRAAGDVTTAPGLCPTDSSTTATVSPDAPLDPAVAPDAPTSGDASAASPDADRVDAPFTPDPVETPSTPAGPRPAGGLAFFTKRATVSGVYGATLLFFLSRGDDQAALEAFLDRRLAGVARIGRLRRRFSRGAPRGG